MFNYSINVRTYLSFFIFILLSILPAYALDTEVYQADIKQNAYILLDNSGSMDYGVYESNIDYGDMYDYLYTKSNIIDTISNWYNNHYETRKIFLAKGEISVSIIEDGKKAFTGDAADPDYLWFSNDMVDTHTYIDTSGNLTGEAGYTQRVTSDSEGHILLDGSRLPLGQDILLKDFNTLYDGSMINEGFGGILNAPGYHFSGFEGVGTNASEHNQVEDGDDDIYFFITGNWMNMQQMYNLHYTTDHDKPAWKYEEFPISSDDWTITPLSTATYDYPPGSGDYLNNQDETIIIKHSGASKIQIHFSLFDIDTWGNSNSGWDYVALYDSSNTRVGLYQNNYNDGDPIVDGWSPVVNGESITIKIHTNKTKTASGITIDQYRSVEGDAGGETGTYLMQNRLDVAKDAILYVLEEFRGKINWGFSTFQYTGTVANGAKIHQVLNPSLNDDANRAAIHANMKSVDPMYGTPLGEALQDIYEQGYHKKAPVLSKLLCRRNYAIVLSDGFPSGDDDWSRTSYVKPFSDSDGDGFTADPYQYDDPAANYYDDVATWISHHSWIDGSVIDDADIGSSYVNITPHQIAFGAKHPLMLDAAEESGAEYITAYNKTQLVNAFYSLGLMISQAVSFTSPVVSVAADNKIENGNDIYMGLFLPADSQPWKGNLKHFQFGDGTVERPLKWGIYDAGNNIAQDTYGNYLDNTDGYWGDDADANDSNDNNGAAEIDEDGVGEVLTERVHDNFTDGTYYERNIKTWVDDEDEATNNLIDFIQSNISPAILGLTDDDTATRNKIINWVHGYAFNTDESGYPTDVLDDAGEIEQTAVREWSLGPIIHSKPVIIDYYNSSDSTIVDKRLIAIGADDGMLHIFNDYNTAANGTKVPAGTEVFAFVPDDILTSLSDVETSLHESFVDGFIQLYRENGTVNGAPKYLFFGLRRGGSGVWRIDISDSDVDNWTVDKISESEMGQSWSDFSFARIRTADDTYKTAIIFSGGYDPVEDMFPEPFTDDEDDPNGTPFATSGTIDPQEWKSNNDEQDINGNGQYDIYNPNTGAYATTKGRSIYVIDIDTLDVLFSVKHGDTPLPALGVFSSEVNQIRDDFNYCFPATPSVAVVSKIISGVRQDDLLTSIYAPDIYGNLFRITYDYNDGSPQWQVKHIFSANPASSSASGELDVGQDSIDTSDTGRKVFYGPAVSWGGSDGYFKAYKYAYPNTEFSGTDKIASLFFGTGDRVHPSYTIVRNRFYAVYDDSLVSASKLSGEVAVTSVAYSEDDLLNITCDELGKDTTQVSGDTDAYRTAREDNLKDDVVNVDSSDPMELDSGNGEDDAKGWYIILDQQGDNTYCSHCDYEATVDDSVGGRDNHDGEKILSRILLTNGKAIFTAYQTALSDPCTPQGNGFIYALDYTDGSAALNLNSANDDLSDDDDPFKKDVTDRYGKYSGINVIPSSPVLVIRDREHRVFTNFGDGFPIDHDSKPNLYYWIER